MISGYPARFCKILNRQKKKVNLGAQLNAGASIVALLFIKQCCSNGPIKDLVIWMQFCYLGEEDMSQKFVLVFHKAVHCFIGCLLVTEPVQLPNKADSRLEYAICSYHLYHNPNDIFLAFISSRW